MLCKYERLFVENHLRVKNPLWSKKLKYSNKNSYPNLETQNMSSIWNNQTRKNDDYVIYRMLILKSLKQTQYFKIGFKGRRLHSICNYRVIISNERVEYHNSHLFLLLVRKNSNQFAIFNQLPPEIFFPFWKSETEWYIMILSITNR